MSMTMKYEDAIDVMFGLIKDWADAQSPVPPIRWPNEPTQAPDTEVLWIRVSIKPGPANQATLGDATGIRAFDRTGLLIVDVLDPIGQGLTTVYTVASSVANIFENSRMGALWFRNTRLKELPADGAFKIVKILTEFEYSEYK
jgi:hypothetical protein